MFWSYFENGEENKDLILEKVNLLPHADVIYLYSRFGRNLDKNYYNGPEIEKKIKGIIKKIKKMLENPNYVPRNYRINTGKNGPIVTYRMNDATGNYEVSGKSDFPYEGKTLEEITNIDFAEINKLLYNFKNNADIVIIFQRAFKTALDGKANTSGFTKDEINSLLDAINKLKELNQKALSKKETAKYDLLASYYGKSLATIWGCGKVLEYFIINHTMHNSRSKELLQDFASGKKIEVEETKLCYNTIRKIYGKIGEYEEKLANLGYQKKYEIYQKFLLTDILNCSEDELYYAFEAFSAESKEFDLVYSFMKHKIIKEEDLPTFCKTISKMQNAIIMARLQNLSNIDIATSSDILIEQTPFIHPIFQDFVELLPEEYRLITKIRLGLYDGRVYSIAAIASIYGLSGYYVDAMTTKGINFFESLLKGYEEIFKQESEVSLQLNRFRALSDPK